MVMRFMKCIWPVLVLNTVLDIGEFVSKKKATEYTVALMCDVLGDY